MLGSALQYVKGTMASIKEKSCDGIPPEQRRPNFATETATERALGFQKALNGPSFFKICLPAVRDQLEKELKGLIELGKAWWKAGIYNGVANVFRAFAHDPVRKIQEAVWAVFGYFAEDMNVACLKDEFALEKVCKTGTKIITAVLGGKGLNAVLKVPGKLVSAASKTKAGAMVGAGANTVKAAVVESPVGTAGKVALEATETAAHAGKKTIQKYRIAEKKAIRKVARSTAGKATKAVVQAPVKLVGAGVKSAAVTAVAVKNGVVDAAVAVKDKVLKKTGAAAEAEAEGAVEAAAGAEVAESMAVAESAAVNAPRSPASGANGAGHHGKKKGPGLFRKGAPYVMSGSALEEGEYLVNEPEYEKRNAQLKSKEDAEREANDALPDDEPATDEDSEKAEPASTRP